MTLNALEAEATADWADRWIAHAAVEFVARISDGRFRLFAVTQSTQDHIRDLEAAFERLSSQVNRLG
jgi:hypothetical protein